MNVEMERRHLAKAEVDVAKARKRVDDQRAIIVRLGVNGHDTAAAKSVLQTMLETLAAMEDHRDIIKRGLERHESRPA